MEDKFAIQLFEGNKVRVVWDEKQEKYFFSVVDIIQVLTDSVDAKQYIKRLRSRDPELNLRWGTICTPTEMRAADGKMYKTQAADLQGIFRIIQSVPSKKAEPVKQWLAQLGQQRIDQMIDPEQTFQMAVEDYRRQGYKDFAILTNVLTQAWSGMTTGEYKKFKGLTKENLRDNMTNIELALNTLAEVAATEYSRQSNPQTMEENKRVAREGGDVAREARKTMEKRLGRSVVSKERASDYIIDASKKDKKGKLPFDDENK